MPYYPPPSSGGAADASLSPLSPSVDTTVTASYSEIVCDWFEINTGKTLDVGLAGVFEVT